MNELLQKHGCANVFTVPEGLKELMYDITREVLRAQPPNLPDFIANYLSVLIITREHGVMAVSILEDLCDCRPSVTEQLEAMGITPLKQAAAVAAVMQEEIEKEEPMAGNEKVSEAKILKKILQRYHLDELMSAKVCQIARNAYRDYWYRKRLLKQSLSKDPQEPWEVAAAYTLEIYKRTNPSFAELNRATEKIQAAYKGYHVRRKLLGFHHHEKPGPDRNPPGKPLDIAESREIELGHKIAIKVRKDNVADMFDAETRDRLGINYDTRRMLTHVCICDELEPPEPEPPKPERQPEPVTKISFSPPKPTSPPDAPEVKEVPALAVAKDMDEDESDDTVDEDLSDDRSARSEGSFRKYDHDSDEDVSYTDDKDDEEDED